MKTKGLKKHVPEMILNLNFEYLIITATHKSINFFGYQNTKDFIGKNFLDLFLPEEKQNVLKLIEEIKQTGKSSTDYFELFNRNIEMTMDLLYDAHMDGESFLVILQEVDLHENDRDYENLLKYITKYNKCGVAVHDINMNYLFVSEKYIDQYGVKETDIIGKNHYEIFPDLPDKWKEVHKRALKGEVIREERDPYIRENNLLYWTSWECRPWYKHDNTIGGIIIYTDIINTQIELEDEVVEKINQLKEQSERVETILNSIDQAVISAYDKENIVFANRAALKLLGLNYNQVIGKPYNEIVKIYDDKTKQRVKSAVEIVIETHNVYESTENMILISHDNKKYYIESKATPLLDSNDYLYGVFTFIKDVTDKKRVIEGMDFHTTHNTLTGLYNRTFITEKLIKLDTEQHYPIGVLIMDINGLKLINDAFGYKKGDEVIKKVAETLKTVCKDEHIPGKFSGGEFIILFKNINVEVIKNVKDRIEKNLSENNIEISLSYGYAIREDKSIDLAQFITIVENNMYKNKIIDSRSIKNNSIVAILKTLTNKYTYELIHSQRVSYYCKKMGEALNLSNDEIKELEIAGLYHDIGKISIPDNILGKPGKLNEFEFEKMKSHTTAGFQILRAADAYSSLAEYALSHHERWDGNGYPNHLRNEQIPYFARIICITDAYEAMTSDRVYRTKLTQEDAAREILRCSGAQFDPHLVNVFVGKVLNITL